MTSSHTTRKVHRAAPVSVSSSIALCPVSSCGGIRFCTDTPARVRVMPPLSHFTRSAGADIPPPCCCSFHAPPPPATAPAPAPAPAPASHSRCSCFPESLSESLPESLLFLHALRFVDQIKAIILFQSPQTSFDCVSCYGNAI